MTRLRRECELFRIADLRVEKRMPLEVLCVQQLWTEIGASFSTLHQCKYCGIECFSIKFDDVEKNYALPRYVEASSQINGRLYSP
jgi:hypothetical protein